MVAGRRTSDTDQAVQIAVLQTEVKHLSDAVADLKAVNAAQSEKLDNLLRVIEEARGGWKVLMMVGGAAGAIGSAVSWVISHMK